MDTIVLKITNRLERLKLIEKNDKAIYSYQIEMLFMKIIGIVLIAGIGIITKNYIETIVFSITF